MTSEKNIKALNEIYNNLKNGRYYGHCFYNPDLRFTDYGYSFYFHIGYNPITRVFCYSNYGSSAIKATKKQLNWLIRHIFRVDPFTFTKKYVLDNYYNAAVQYENTTALHNMYKCYINN